MANFTPLKNRFLLELDISLSDIPLNGRFLDYGCGSADVAAHLIQKHKLKGDLLEVDHSSCQLIRENPLFNDCQLYASSDELPDSSYDLIVLFDVLEHLPQPEQVLKSLYNKLSPGGKLAIVIPYRQSTWGWDDDHYGHLRRWSHTELQQALESSDFTIIQMSDPTFPVYGFLRWLMLRLQNKSQSPHVAVNQNEYLETMRQRSKESPHNNAWKKPPKLINYLPWTLINYLTLPFNKMFKGDEIFSLSIKQRSVDQCSHCRRKFNYLNFYNSHVLRECPKCHSKHLKNTRDL